MIAPELPGTWILGHARGGGGGGGVQGISANLTSFAHTHEAAWRWRKLKDAGAAVIEREDIWGRPVAPRLAEWGARPPARWRVATSVVPDAHARLGAACSRSGAVLDRRGAVGTQTPPSTPEPRVKQVPHRITEHV